MRTIYKERSGLEKLLALKNSPFMRFTFPGHFYSPIPSSNEIEARSAILFDRSMQQVPAIRLNTASQLQLLKHFSKLYSQIPFSDRERDNLRYYYDNGTFSYGDGVVLYCLMRHFRPKRVVEIGSGFSSAEMLDINDLVFNSSIRFTFIDPEPDLLFSVTSPSDKTLQSIVTKPVQDVPISTFSKLSENDILFVDSSHVAKIGSDVLHIFFNVMPSLKTGVIIHFHDIPWPFEYPEIWLESGRAWNEAYFLRAFLQYNEAYQIMYFNSYMEIHHPESVKMAMPKALKVPSKNHTLANSSLWLRKTV